MNYESIVPWLALFALVVGWFVNSYFNRKHEIAKKRMNIRIGMFNRYISHYQNLVESKKFDPHKFSRIQNSFTLYGYDDEIDLINTLAKLIKDHIENPIEKKDLDWGKKMIELNKTVIKNLREELKFPKN